MLGYHKIEALKPGVHGNDPGPAPEVLFLSVDQLVINEDYQRELSKPSRRLIRKIAANWDWGSYKAPSVCATEEDGVYEVVDGQHTAIGAATNGNIPFLPCLKGAAATLAAKAKGFLGINQNRIALTAAAVFNAQVAAQDEAAIAVEVAMSSVCCSLLHVPPPNGGWKVGDTMAVGTLMNLARARGQARVALVLKIAKDAHAAPISSALVKALDIALPLEPTPDAINRVTATLRGQGCGRLELICKSRTPHGRRVYEALADTISDMAKLGDRRLGRSPSRPGRKPKLAVAA